jgi:hypothetical protein
VRRAKRGWRSRTPIITGRSPVSCANYPACRVRQGFAGRWSISQTGMTAAPIILAAAYARRWLVRLGRGGFLQS